MRTCQLLLPLVLVLILSGCVSQPAEDNPLEMSALAIEMANGVEGVEIPVNFGFQPNDLVALAEDDAPQWFCPKSTITREQLASFVARTELGPKASMRPYAGQFTDVNEMMTHADEIGWMFDAGLTDGCAEETFCPDHGVTRGQMALFTVRMIHGAEFELPQATQRYLDLPVGHPHAAAVEQLARDGFDLGCDSHMFCADRPVTRDEVASFLVVAKYGDEAPAVGNSFADIAGDNPHARAANILLRDGITYGCDAPPVGYRLQGEPLSERQRDWLLYFAGHSLPRISRAMQDPDRAHTASAAAIWWSLKEGIFGVPEDPFRHSLCDGAYISPFDACTGTWEVGLTATVVPQENVVRAAASALYPERDSSQVALDALEFGRKLSSTYAAGAYPGYATDRVSTDMTVQRSWLARDVTVGAWLMMDFVERNCVTGGAEVCFGNETESMRDFAPDAQKAAAVRADIRRILLALRPR